MVESLKKAREALTKTVKSFRDLDRRIRSHHEDDPNLCRNYSEYLSVSPSSSLDRAETILAKNFYRIAFVGGFSCGKSTLINVILNEAGLLPAAAGECTLSITNLSKPKPGKGELVEVHYFAKDEAVRNVFTNIRYKVLFGEEGDAIVRQFDARRAHQLITEEAAATGQGRCSGDLSNAEMMKRRGELKEFLVELEDKHSQGKLGSVVYDSIREVNRYLTTDNDEKGLGHLLLIQMVNIYKDSPIFVHDGVEVIDLPGTDSINERQKELTHSYLHEADVVVNVLAPRGFSAADKEIEKVFRGATLTNIKSKMFFVVNRFDELGQHEINTKGNLKKLLEGQIRAVIAQSGLDPKRMYLTSALWSDFASRGSLTDAESSKLKAMQDNGKYCLETLQSIGEMEDISPDLRDRLKDVYTNGGVDKLREDLLVYLKQDIERERLHEVYTYLLRIQEQLDRLLQPEHDDVRPILESTRHRVRQVGEFIDRVQYDTRTAFRNITDSLEENNQKRFTNAMKHLSRSFENTIVDLLKDNNQELDFRDIADQVGIANSQPIMVAIVDAAKKVLSSKFIDAVSAGLVPEFLKSVRDELEKCRNEPVLKYFANVLRQDDSFLDEYNGLCTQFERDIEQICRKRATEETWVVEDLDLTPGAKRREWEDEVIQRFRKTYTTVFKDVFRDRFKSLSQVLLRYFKLILDDFNASFEEMLAQVREEARYENLTIPVELFEHKSDQETLKKYKIADYISSAEETQKALTTAKSLVS